MILTEEELAKLLINSSERDLTEEEIFSMYDSHRLLLIANAELSFKNMELQEENKKMSGAIDSLQQQMWEGI